MIKRRKTSVVKTGPVKIGSTHPIAIQSMTKVATTDLTRCLRQINQLADAGADLVRIALPRRADTAAFAKLVKKTRMPLIADIHFAPARAIEAIEAGAVKVRLNPGNIKKRSDIIRIIDAAKIHGTAIRIGINEASIRDLKKPDVPMQKRITLMLNEMKKYVRIFEKQKFTSLILSAKSPDTMRTIWTNRAIAEAFDYPIHLGLTHAGLPEDAAIPSSIAVGALLAEGIGDTIRISLAGNPVQEIIIAKQILTALGLYAQTSPQLIVCPTCGRTQIDVLKLARKVKKLLTEINKPIRVAVMGCIVNGPGEAADADLAVCAAKTKAYIYRKGKKIFTVNQSQILPMLAKELAKF